jgi:hypothetical protein
VGDSRRNTSRNRRRDRCHRRPSSSWPPARRRPLVAAIPGVHRGWRLGFRIFGEKRQGGDWGREIGEGLGKAAGERARDWARVSLRRPFILTR